MRLETVALCVLLLGGSVLLVGGVGYDYFNPPEPATSGVAKSCHAGGCCHARLEQTKNKQVLLACQTFLSGSLLASQPAAIQGGILPLAASVSQQVGSPCHGAGAPAQAVSAQPGPAK